MLEVTCLYSLTALGESSLTKLILKSLNAYDRNKSAYGKVYNRPQLNHIAFADLLGKIVITSITRCDCQMMNKRTWIRTPNHISPPVIPFSFLIPLCQTSWKDAWQTLFTMCILICCLQPLNCQILSHWLTPSSPSPLLLFLLLHKWGTWIWFCPHFLSLCSPHWAVMSFQSLTWWCSR